MTKDKKIKQFLTDLSEKIVNSDIKNYLREKWYAPPFAIDKKNNRIARAILLENGLSHLVIWYNIDEKSSDCEIWSSPVDSGCLTANYIIKQEGIEDEDIIINYDKDKLDLTIIYDYGEININKIDHEILADYCEKIWDCAKVLLKCCKKIDEAEELNVDKKVLDFFNKLRATLAAGILNKEIINTGNETTLKNVIGSNYEVVWSDISLNGSIFRIDLYYDILDETLQIDFCGKRYSLLKKECDNILKHLRKYIPAKYSQTMFDTQGKGKDAIFKLVSFFDMDIGTLNDVSLNSCVELIKDLLPWAREAEIKIREYAVKKSLQT